MKTLIIYYSRKGENYVNGSIVNLKQGNTERVVEYIQKAVEADVFEIETINEYSSDYTTCTKESLKELKSHARPTLKKYISDIYMYDNIVIAGPCWWGTYPMAMFLQLEKLDWNGKYVFPVMTHEGSGMGDSLTDVKSICKGAIVEEGIAIQGCRVSDSQDMIVNWANKYLK